MKRKIIIVFTIVILGVLTACLPDEMQKSSVAASTQTLPIGQGGDISSPTVVPSATIVVLPTATNTVLPTETTEPTTTPFPYYGDEPYPTSIAFQDGDQQISDLKAAGFNLLFSTSTTGVDGKTYSAYIFVDSSFPKLNSDDMRENIFPELVYRELDQENHTEGCRVLFYRSNGYENEFIGSFGAPKYPDGTVYDNYPLFCAPNDWSHPFVVGYYYSSDEDYHEELSIQGAWSDINQNGDLEFSVMYQHCGFACLDRGAVSTRIYEIQSGNKVIDITANLPGVIEPFRLVHSDDPFEFYVYDPTLWYCYKWCVIDTWWIYSWEDNQLHDVTSTHADEYRLRGAKIVENIQAKYGENFRDSELLTILFLYEKVGLRNEAIDIFLEISEPSNWPNASQEEICWLQVARATAIDDYEMGRPFQFPQVRLEGAMVDTKQQFTVFDPDFEMTEYDLSACEEFLP